MECMAREGWLPTLSLWEESGTVLSELAQVTVAPEGMSGEEFIKYTCLGKDIDAILTELTDQGFDVTQV